MPISQIQAEMLALSKNVCKAWVNFNGQGAVSIIDSFNVSSIDDNGTGDQTVNMTNDFADTNYSILGWARSSLTGTRSDSFNVRSQADYVKSVNSARFYTSYTNGSAQVRSDSPEISIHFYGELA